MGDGRASLRSLRVLWAAVLVSTWVGHARCGAGFGAVVEHTVSFTPAAVSVVPGPAGARSEILVLARDRPMLVGHMLTDEGVLVETRTLRTPDRCGAIAEGDFDGDGRREFTLLSSGGSRIHSYLRHPSGWLTRRLGPGTRAEKVLAADLNADGFGDVLCFGQSMAGGLLYLGSRRGLVDSAALVLPDVSIADAVVLDVNGDRVPDVLIADWLGNAVILFAGLDGLTFTEAARVDVPDTPLEIDIAESSADSPALIGVLLGDGRTVRTYSLQPRGDVWLTEESRLEETASDLCLVDVDGNRQPELVVTTPSGLLLSEVSRGRRSTPWTTYGVYPHEGALVVRDVDGDGRRDLVVAEGARRKLLVCGNSAPAGVTSWPENFITPGEPAAVVLADVDLDGDPDVVVACRRPPVLAVLAGDGRGTYALGQTVGIPERPTALIAVPARRGIGSTIVTSHASSNALGVITLDERGSPVSVRTISTGNEPLAVAAVRDSGSALRILARTRRASGGGQALSWFDELPSGVFVERPSGLPGTVNIIQAVADDDMGPAPVIVALMKGEGGEGLYAWQGRAFPGSWGTLQDLRMSSTELLACDLSPPGNLAVFYSRRAPGATVIVATLSVAAGQWSQPVVTAAPAPRPADGSIAADFAGDGTSDLLYVDRGRGVLVLLPRDAAGLPAAPRDVMPAVGVRLAAVGEAGAVGSRDFLVLREGVSAVSVIRGGVHP